HFERKFGIGDVLNLSRNQFSLLSKFFLKLFDERLRSLQVCCFVGGARVVRDAVSNRRNGRENGHKKQQEKFRPEAHGLAPASDLARASRGATKGSLSSSHTSPRRQSPQADGDQFRTRRSSAAKSGTATSGKIVFWFIIRFSQ